MQQSSSGSEAFFIVVMSLYLVALEVRSSGLRFLGLHVELVLRTYPRTCAAYAGSRMGSKNRRS